MLLVDFVIAYSGRLTTLFKRQLCNWFLRKKKVRLFTNHNRGLQRLQLGALTIGHSPNNWLLH